jgi:uncharacterized membrane protein YgcG
MHNGRVQCHEGNLKPGVVVVVVVVVVVETTVLLTVLLTCLDLVGLVVVAFFFFQCTKRDALWLTVVGSNNGQHVLTMVSPGTDPLLEAGLFEQSRLMQPVVTRDCPTIHHGHNNGGTGGTGGTGSSQEGGGDVGGGTSLASQEQSGVVQMLLRQLASTAEDGQASPGKDKQDKQDNRELGED